MVVVYPAGDTRLAEIMVKELIHIAPVRWRDSIGPTGRRCARIVTNAARLFCRQDHRLFVQRGGDKGPAMADALE